MRLMRSVSPLLLLLALASCTRSPTAQLRMETQAVTSWTATARMVGEQWAKGNVPQAYAARTLRTAEETLAEELKAIEEQPSDGAAELRASLGAHARGLGQVIERMRAAVEQRDGATLSRLLEQLKAQEQAVRALSQSGGSQP